MDEGLLGRGDWAGEGGWMARMEGKRGEDKKERESREKGERGKQV